LVQFYLWVGCCIWGFNFGGGFYLGVSLFDGIILFCVRCCGLSVGFVLFVCYLFGFSLVCS